MTEFFRKNMVWIGLIGILILQLNCSLTTFQSPKVLTSGEKAIGAGFAGAAGPIHVDGTGAMYPGTGPIEVSGYTRIGLGHNFDAGVKLFVAPLGIFGDLKYQILKKPFLLSTDFGLSYSWYPADQCIAFYPMLLFGSESYYGGIKVIYLEESTNPGIMMGASLLRGKFRVMPEVNIYGLSEHDIFIVGGLGIQYIF